MDLEVYVFEDENGNEDSFSTMDADVARDYASTHHRKWIARKFEYADSELVEDYTTLEGRTTAARNRAR